MFPTAKFTLFLSFSIVKKSITQKLGVTKTDQLQEKKLSGTNMDLIPIIFKQLAIVSKFLGGGQKILSRFS